MAEKDLLPSPPHHASGRQQPRTTWKGRLCQFVVIAILTKFYYDIATAYDLFTAWEYSNWHGGDSDGEASATSAAQCLQVEPLVPLQRSSALVEMDEYIASTEFRDKSVANLAGAIQVPTQSYDDMGPVGEDERWDVLYDLAAYLKKTFPLVHSNLEVEKVNTHGLLYTWPGTDPALKPTVLMGHQDVVPVAEATAGQWTHPPFSGEFDGHYIWGRGSFDDKNNVVGMLEAVELLLKAGFAPKRTVVLSFGFDEEISGWHGARNLATVLIDRYGKDGAAVIIDEGAGTSSAWGTSFAQPGVAEKGAIDVEIIVRMPGGHSSIPPAHNGIGVTAELITRIEADPYEPRLHAENPYLGLLQCGAAHSPDFPPKLKKLLRSHGTSSSSSGTCRKKNKKDKLALEAAKLGDDIKYLFTTSVAPDVISGGVKSNALPERTRVLVDHRVNVGETSAAVQEKIASIARSVAQKYNLTVSAYEEALDGNTDTAADEKPSSITLRLAGHVLEPSPVTPTSILGVTPYAVLSGTSRAVYGREVLVAPGIMTGNTDTRYYWDLTRHIFRYNPGWDPEQEGFGGIHTVNEKISLLAHVRAVQWFSMFIRNMDEALLA